MKKAIINPLNLPSLPPLPLPRCLTSSLPPSVPPAPCSLRPSHLLFSLAPSLSHIIASSLPPLAPSVPPIFYSPSLLPCPSLPACLLPCNSIYTVCVYSVGELHWVLCMEGPARRRYAARRDTETMEWSRHQQVARCYLGNAPPRRIRFWRIVKKIRRSKRATNTHKHGRSSYLSVGTGGDVQTLLEAEPLRSKDRGLLTYNIDFGVCRVRMHADTRRNYPIYNLSRTRAYDEPIMSVWHLLYYDVLVAVGSIGMRMTNIICYESEVTDR